MKNQLTALLCAVLIPCAFSGCNKSESIDTSRIEKSFESADSALKSAVEPCITALKDGNWSAAGTQLEKVLANAKITPEQKQAVTSVLEQIKAKLTEAAAKASDSAKNAGAEIQKKAEDAAEKAKASANKAAEDLKKSLGK